MRGSSSILLCFTLLVTYTTGAKVIPVLKSIDTKSLVSFLIQAPPVVKAACYVKDLKSGGVIVNKVCACGDSTVKCDVGPIIVGDVQLTFCNKKQSQTIEDLLVLAFACNITEPSCGVGTPCDIGPVIYNNRKYFLCTDQTVKFPDNKEICKPGGDRTDGPQVTLPTTAERKTGATPEGPDAPTTRSRPTPITELKTSTTPEVRETPTPTTQLRPTPQPTSSTTTEQKTSTTPEGRTNPPSIKTTIKPPWRPWFPPPRWPLPPTWGPPNLPGRFPTLPPLLPPHALPQWPPMWSRGGWSRWCRGFGRGWDFGHEPRWSPGGSRSWGQRDRNPDRSSGFWPRFGGGRGRSGRRGRDRYWSSESSSSSDEW